MKHKEKIKETNPRLERQLELLGKLGNVDRENKIITSKLHYHSVSELLKNDISTDELPVISEDVIDRADELIDKCPSGYRSAVEVKIDDYEGYEPKKVLECFNETMEIEHYRTVKQGRKSWYLAALLALVGVSLLIILNVLKVTGVIGEDRLEDLIIDYVIDTFACVFIWECISMVLLYPAEFYKRNNKVILFFAGLTLLDAEGNVVACEDKEEMMKEWIDESGKKKTGKAFLMVMGTALIAVGLVALSSAIVSIAKIDYSTITSENMVPFVFMAVTCFVIAICEILAGIGSINMVREKGLFRKFVKIFSIILLLFYAAYIGISIYAGITLGREGLSPGLLVTVAFGLIMVILILIGYHYSKEIDVKRSLRKKK